MRLSHHTRSFVSIYIRSQEGDTHSEEVAAAAGSLRLLLRTFRGSHLSAKESRGTHNEL
jgi:hypothetical protein